VWTACVSRYLHPILTKLDMNVTSFLFPFFCHVKMIVRTHEVAWSIESLGYITLAGHMPTTSPSANS
jgi:hypothetical protein